MNYLAHALLSFDDQDVLAGNMIADFVKGRLTLPRFPKGVQTGILLHRKIDEFTDRHPAVVKAKNLFRPGYRLYSGAMVDALWDHYLANDPRYFTSEAMLADFCAHVYRVLGAYSEILPPGFARLLPYMQQQNWLYHYRHLKGLQQAFGGVVRRARFLDNASPAYFTTMRYYHELNQLYCDFIDDAYNFAKNELKI